MSNKSVVLAALRHPQRQAEALGTDDLEEALDRLAISLNAGHQVVQRLDDMTGHQVNLDAVLEQSVADLDGRADLNAAIRSAMTGGPRESVSVSGGEMR